MALQSLKNKKIIISAGASGIGWAIAKICLSKGASIYLCDIDSKNIGKIKKHPLNNKKLFIYEYDAAEEYDVENFFDKIRKKTIVFITHDLDESLRLGDHIGILNGGRLVQVGTPIDIIMKPADDYVAAFVKDVNRAKVIKAKIIMISPQQFKGSKNSNTIKVSEDTFLDEFLPKVCLTPATVEVVDKSGNIKGYITDKELSKALTKSHSNGVVKSQK